MLIWPPLNLKTVSYFLPISSDWLIIGKAQVLKIVSECDQEIPQSQTADNPMASRGRATLPSRVTRKTNQAKQPALPSPPR